ncbi:MAG TPA: flavoprotein, partial [bacterium]|nr:flavoprotein [bacterium]
MSERPAHPLGGKRVVLGVTSSIAAYKAVDLTSRLRRLSAEVSVVMTPDALEFVTPLSFEAISGNAVVADLFEESADPVPAHISLGTEADIVIVAPASADFIGRAAAGLADN